MTPTYPRRLRSETSLISSPDASVPVPPRKRTLFPELGESLEEARAICVDCPVVVECRLTAAGGAEIRLETWFSILTRRVLTKTSFGSKRELSNTIETWTSFWNDDPEAFVWTTNAEDIITKVRRGRAALDDVTKSATHH